MTKADLIDKIASKAGLTKANADKALGAFLDAVQEELLASGKIVLTGFGAFSVENRNARAGRNPRTGAAMEIPAQKVAKFKPGKNLKEAVKYS